MRRIGIGLIGSGFMGRSHTLAFRAAPAVLAPAAVPVLEMLADIDEPSAAQAAQSLGYSRATADWQALVRDPAVHLVDITTPNALHKPMALAAIAAGKHVYCEKPLAASAADATEMARAAQQAGVQTFVGLNYLKNPLLAAARAMIEGGEIGTVVSFRGIHAEDYMADPLQPWTWRLDPAGGHGAVADLGSHILSIARHLAGDIVEVSGQIATVVAERPVARGSTAMRAVAVDDQARALLRFASGATGSIEASWVATGRKMTIGFEVTGTKGTIAFDQERMNELQVFTAGQPRGREGFRTILTGPDHPPYGQFCPAPGHHLGYNDLKTIEVAAILDALAGGPRFAPDFAEAARIQACVDAIVTSARERRWVSV
ncbi:MAG: Gfo/Idh/MocA family oxidoreductase [Alphaproteobacteria bacterium]|nr:Gfo/Idh/MocA family oxidoreductase [Alphaproteobacteria bacterium]